MKSESRIFSFGSNQEHQETVLEATEQPFSHSTAQEKEEFLQKEETQKQFTKIREQIVFAIHEYEFGPKESDDYQVFMKQVSLWKAYSKETWVDVMTEDVIGELVDLTNEYLNRNKYRIVQDEKGNHAEVYNESHIFQEILNTDEEETQKLLPKVFRAFQKFSGENRFSPAFSSEAGSWIDQHFLALPDDEFLEFLNDYYFLDDRETTDYCMSFPCDERVFERLKKIYQGNPENIRIRIEVLNHLTDYFRINEDEYSHKVAERIQNTLKDIAEISQKNYYLKLYCEYLDENLPKEVLEQRLWNQYHGEAEEYVYATDELRKKYDDSKTIQRIPSRDFRYFDEPSVSLISGTRYGAEYDGLAPVYFFDRKRGANDRINIKTILRNEGLEEEGLDNDIFLYENFLKLPIRDFIETDFQIILKDFSIREQLQFLKFLSEKDISEVERVKSFVGSAGNTEGVKHRIRAFLALEADSNIGESVVSIGENLNQQEADMVFSAYAETLDTMQRKIDELYLAQQNVYGTVLYSKSALSKTLLLSANAVLNRVSSGKQKNASAQNVVDSFREENEIFEKQCAAFEHTGKSLEEFYRKQVLIYIKKEDSLQDEDLVNELLNWEKHAEDMEQWIKKENPQMLQDFQEWKQEEGPITRSSLLRYMISDLETKMNPISHKLYEHMKLKGGYEATVADWMMNKEKSLAEAKYKEIYPKLKSFLKLQTHFEEMFTNLIFRKQEAGLPKDFFQEVVEEKQYMPERFPKDGYQYFPAGISKDLASWQEVWEGKKIAEKPIDLHGYLFWLQNQGVPLEIVVADEMQRHNYQNLYPEKLGENPDKQAREYAKMIGKSEREQYQKIIDTFGLTNLKVVEYGDFYEKRKEKIQEYAELCHTLSKDPIFSGAFKELVGDSVDREIKFKEEKQKYLGYGIEEVAWIMACDETPGFTKTEETKKVGLKISHPNEAKYDVLAAVLRNIMAYAESQNRSDIFALENRAQMIGVLNEVLTALYDKFNGLKQKSTKESPQYEYYEKAGAQLKRIRRQETDEMGKRKSVESPKKFNPVRVFWRVIPSPAPSYSFGWGGYDHKTKQESSFKMKFREPYSTYFHAPDEPGFLQSDQVVCEEEKEVVGGKLLAIQPENQRQYAEKMIRPFLREYVQVLKTAPERYFETLGKTPKEILDEISQCRTVADAMGFVEQYILKPQRTQNTPEEILLTSDSPDSREDSDERVRNNTEGVLFASESSGPRKDSDPKERWAEIWNKKSAVVTGMENKEQEKQPDFTPELAEEEDADDIVELQQMNLGRNLSDEDKKQYGFVSLETPEELVREVIADEGVVVVKDGKKVLAYLMPMKMERAATLPLLIPLVERFENLAFEGKPLSKYRQCFLAQICIDRKYRGKGILEKLYKETGKKLSEKYDIALSEIAADNPRSLEAHIKKIGIQVLEEYEENGRKWNIVMLDLRKYRGK